MAYEHIGLNKGAGIGGPPNDLGTLAVRGMVWLPGLAPSHVRRFPLGSPFRDVPLEAKGPASFAARSW